jgi:hypothetical protein
MTKQAGVVFERTPRGGPDGGNVGSPEWTI